MKAHISDESIRLKETNEKLTSLVQAKLLEQRQNGLAEGCKAISKVVYDKATDESKSYEERIRDIIIFCETGLTIKTEEEENKSE